MGSSLQDIVHFGGIFAAVFYVCFAGYYPVLFVHFAAIVLPLVTSFVHFFGILMPVGYPSIILHFGGIFAAIILFLL